MRLWPWLGLMLVVGLGAAFRFGNLQAIGESNTYYTAAVKSMLQSWSNFYFVAAEPGGSVSIDKPPVGLWLETLSAAILGVSGFSVVLPNLLAGLASIAVLFHLIRRSFGNWPALVGALTLAVTPVAIAVERNNTPDAVLVLTLLLAAWAFSKATETVRLRWLLAGAVFVGVGFNVKMLQAYLPLPAFYALYLFGASAGWRRKILHLAATTGVLFVVSLSWAVSVDLTPADQRPYVGSSTSNSELALIVGYNGIERLIGGPGRGGGASAAQGVPQAPPGSPNDPGAPLNAPPGDGPRDGGRQDGGPPGGGLGGAFGTGQAGPLRLFQAGLASQVSWLLPFALVALAALVVELRPRRYNPDAPDSASTNAWRNGVILWGGWLLTGAVFFSVAQFFHQYYLTMLGAPLAAVVAIGMAYLWRMTPSIRLPWLAGAAFVTLAFQVYAAALYGRAEAWLVVPVAAGLVAVACLTTPSPSLARAGIALLVVALLIVPAVWSGLTTAYVTETGGLPQAYGTAGSRGGNQPLANAGPPTATRQGLGGGRTAPNAALLAYLQANTSDVKYLIVVPSSQQGAGYVLATGRPVLYAGGFNGSDAVIDASRLASLVDSHAVRFVLWGGGGGPGRNSLESGIAGYLKQSCSVVPPTTWEGSTVTTGAEASFLYRCDAATP